MFTVADRDRVRTRILELARSDARVVSGAEVGSLAHGDGDRWSDLDLTFGVEASLEEVLDDWTRVLAEELSAVVLFDLPVQGIVYRVFLLPDCLQVDVSVAPAAEFRQTSPRFKLLWGEAKEKLGEPPPAEELFGYGAMWIRHARFSIERGKRWQAELAIGELRNSAMALACRRRGLNTRYAKGSDQLPAELSEKFEAAMVRSLDREELLRALEQATVCLLQESEEVRDLAASVEPQLLELASSVLD